MLERRPFEPAVRHDFGGLRETRKIRFGPATLTVNDRHACRSGRRVASASWRVRVVPRAGADQRRGGVKLHQARAECSLSRISGPPSGGGRQGFD